MSHVVIIGAGIVGAATAIEALKRGFQVTILDPGEPGGEQAASYGNGCWLNPLSVIPPALPGLWKKVPKFLMDPLGPLAIRWTYFPRVAPWLVRYLLAGWTEDKVRATAHALRGLLKDGPERHLALAREAGVEHLIDRKGLMYVYQSRAEFESERLAWKLRGEVGCTWRELDNDELRQREPELARRYTFAILTEEGASCSDPGAYVAAVVAHAQALGARFVQQPATGLRIEGGRLKAVLTPEGEILADKAVIAAGARSKALAAMAGETLRIESERGYHAEISAPEVEPRTPMMPFDGKMSVIRTRNGLRCAGQVEIAGVDAAPNWKRAEILRDHLLRMLPGLPADMPADRVKVWLGHRPSMPDALPCIGPAKGCPDVILNAGHGHVGLAGGPASAALAAAFLAGEAPGAAESFSPRRFG